MERGGLQYAVLATKARLIVIARDQFNALEYKLFSERERAVERVSCLGVITSPL